MPEFIQVVGQQMIWRRGHETVLIEPWGADAVRVRATMLDGFRDVPGALLEPATVKAKVEVHETGATLTNGRMRAEIDDQGHLRFTNARTKRVLLEEEFETFKFPPVRWWRPLHSDLHSLEVRFLAQAGERFYGLGQQQHGQLNQKGCVVDLFQMNTRVCIPFLLSSRGYGFLWNNPAVGRVELGHNHTRWTAQTTKQMDYVVIAGDSIPQILSRYAGLTGHAPMLPEWAAGFWQSKLRYKTQEEVLEVAREYRRRGLPLSVIVIDFFHWTMLGDWKFDPQCFPDPAGMVKELAEMGVRVMVSIWPQVNLNSPNFEKMQARGMLARAERGFPAVHLFADTFPPGPVFTYLYDPSLPEARQFIWEQVRENYYKLGVKVYWLDADEPELLPHDFDNIRFHLGSGLEIGNIYALLHQQAFYEGMRAEGEKEIITLSRSGWAGSQRYGAAIWSGDIESTFEDLRRQVPAGLNIGLSGIPWWTTDIGGFLNGDPDNPAFRELIVRWFQYGLFCPLFRLHGSRLPSDVRFTGGPNEVWSFGEEAYAAIRPLLFLRERLKPYLLEQMKTAAKTGLPPMRPLFVDFAEDAASWDVEDEFLLGPDLLAAPVLYEGRRSRTVYLPQGAEWVSAWDGQEFAGGQRIEAEAPLERIPVYWRKGSPHQFNFGEV